MSIVRPGTSYDLDPDDPLYAITEAQGEIARLREAVKGGGVTVYAKLMDAALHEPRDEVRNEIELILRGRGLDALVASVIEHLNRAYIAGARDGHADAVIRGATPTKEAKS